MAAHDDDVWASDEGRLRLDEFCDRTGQVLEARTQGDLSP
ncbi:MAG: DUF1707 domain-containing protein [Acidimicrobiales bacterium]